MALTSKSWTGDYILDFTALLSSSTFGQDHVDPNNTDYRNEEDDDDDAPVYSSTTGKYRKPKKYGNGVGLVDQDDLEKRAGQLELRNKGTAVARVLGSAAGESLLSPHVF